MKVIGIIAIIFFTVLGTSLLVGIYQLVIDFRGISFLGLVVYTIIYFLYFLIFIAPAQLFFRRNPKPFSIKRLIVYTVIAIVSYFIVMTLYFSVNIDTFLTKISPVTILSGVIYWLLDSLIFSEEEV